MITAESQAGGFSPGTADRVRTDGGRRAFVKAVSPDQNPDSPDLLRREADYLDALARSPRVPRPIGRYDDGHWIAVAMEEIDGRCPPVPWSDEHVDAAMDTLAALAADLTPSPISGLGTVPEGLASIFFGWQRLRDQPHPGLDPWIAARLDELIEMSASFPAPAGRRHGRPLRHPGRQPVGPPRRLHGRRRLAVGAHRTGLAGPLPAADQHRPVRRSRRRAARRPLPATSGPVADHRLSRRDCARSSPTPAASRVCRVCRPCGPSNRLRRTRRRPGCGGEWTTENDLIGKWLHADRAGAALPARSLAQAFSSSVNDTELMQ